jgi:hypothetical protein
LVSRADVRMAFLCHVRQAVGRPGRYENNREYLGENVPICDFIRIHARYEPNGIFKLMDAKALFKKAFPGR